MAQFVPSLRSLDPRELKDVTVKGGVIVAWGKTDIYDPASELHRRFEIGVTSAGRFHSSIRASSRWHPISRIFARAASWRITGIE
jgi:hypothetical protein